MNKEVQKEVLLKNLTLFEGKENAPFLEHKALWLKADRVVAILDEKELSSSKFDSIPQIDAKKALVAPGFIDAQINGCGGVLFNEAPTFETLKTMDETNRRFGVTSFLPTLITAPKEKRKKAYQAIQDLKKQLKDAFLGLHLEGPFINPIKKGAHPEQHIQKLDEVSVQELLDHQEWIRLITLAPEMCHLKTIQTLKKQSNIKLSIGHSNATFEQANEAIEAGMTLGTHLYNAALMPLPRQAGWVSSVWLDHRVFASVIADGFHVSSALGIVAKRMMGRRLFLITDAMAPSGTDMESCMLEGEKIYNQEGRLTFKDGTLAGSSATMMDCIHVSMKDWGFSLQEALLSASRYAADALSLKEYGRIEPDAKAHLVFLSRETDGTLSVLKTVRRAEEC